MIELTGNNSDDIDSIINEFNYYQKSVSIQRQILISSYGQLDIIIGDGGYPGNAYQAIFSHNSGYAPMFIALYQATNSNQFITLPLTDWIVSGTSIHYTIDVKIDNKNLYATLTFQDSAATPPFYTVGTIFNVYYYVFTNPIIAN